MKKHLLAFCIAWLATLAMHAVSLQPVEAADGVVELPDKDGSYTTTVEGTVTFRLKKNTTYSFKDCGVIFSPAKAGEIIIATVHSVDLPDKGAVLVYDNNIASISSKFAQSGASSGDYSYFPNGWTKAYTGTTTEEEVFQSSDAEGKLAIGLHTKNWTAGKDFLISVTSATPKEMALVSTSLEAGTGLHRGQKNAQIAYINILTDGINSPLILSEISADITTLKEAGIANIALYAGKGTNADSRIAEAGETGQLTWSGERTLASGKNYFTIAGDIPADYSGILTMPTSASATVAGAPQSATAEEATAQVENTIYMSTSPTTYTIGERTAFYDDGGADGKISEQFNGTATFVPATEGHKIRIDFDKLAIFYNSSAVSVGNQDALKFYNGREANEENLIATLTDKAKIIKSTAEDGSLTVTLASKTGVPADGWEAYVSEFVPGDMTIEAAEGIPADKTSASAYDSDALLATVNARAINTLNPLKPESITLSLQGAAAIGKLTVYALDEENAFSTSKKIGEAIPSADGETIITLDAEALAEGSNYFAIAADIKPTASNGDEIKAKATSMSIGGKAYPIECEEAEITVANSYSHRPGTDLIEIHDTWQFISTPDPNYPSKYKYENAECQVTFAPNAGAVAILDFSEFDVYYASGSYGTRAKFEVYSGRTADAAKLLWKLQTDGGKPDGKLKSTAADGSITIVFNANTTSSYYAGKGWKATVTPFINHDMEVKSAIVTQPNTGTVMPGAVAEDFLTINIETEGTLDIRKLTSVTVDLKGNSASISRASLKADDIEIGSAQVEAGTEQATIPCELTLNEGANEVTVAFDIKADAEPDATIDGKVVKIATDKGEIEIEDGDPEGARTAKYQFLMSDGDHTVTVGKTIHFYDDGGSDGYMSKDGLNGTVTFLPEDPTKKIRATVVKYSTAATGILDFYSGREAAGTSLGQCKQRTYPELPMVSKAEDGSMLVNVACKAVSYSSYDGWDILIEQYEPSDLYIKGVNAENAADAATVRGAEDFPISKITVNIEGDTSAIGVKAIKAKAEATNLADIKGLKLWQTGKSDGYSPTRLAGEATIDEQGNATFEIAEPAMAEELGDYYYWITASLSADAQPGNEIAIEIESVTDTKDNNIQASNGAKQSTTVKAGFAGGEFTIGASAEADYATFAAAIAAMGDAIEGAATFLVEPGTYAEDITIDGIKGTSEAKQIIFRSKSGEAADVILTGKGYADGGYGSAKYGIFNVKNTDWVTIDRMTFNGKKSGGTEYPYYVNYVEASRHCTLSNCTLMAETSTSYSGLNEVYATCCEPVENGRNADFLTITGNTFIGGYVAIYIQGSYGYVKNDHMKSLTVTGNTFTDIGSKGVYPYQIEDVLISGNTFTASTAVSKTSYYAIDMVRCKGEVNVANNRIVNSQTVYSSGIYLRDNTHGTAERPVRVYNNSVAITSSPNNSSAGINVATECEYIDLSHNTVNIEGATGYGINISNTKETLQHITLANNLVRANTTGTSALAFCLNRKESLSAFTFTNNAFYSCKDISNLGADLEAWKEATGDNSLIAEEPQFMSASDLHLAEAGSLVGGATVGHVKTDLDGKARAAIPTIGAYEYAALSTEKPEMLEGYPKAEQISHNSARILAKWTVGGRMHYIAKAATAEAPTQEELLAAAAIDAMAEAETAISLTGLESETAYKAYMLLEGSNRQNSEIATVDFTTARYIAPLEVYLDEEQDDCDKDEEVSIIPEITGGDKPYEVKWYDQAGRIVGEYEHLIFTPEASGVYTIEVTSADGQKATAYTALSVYGFDANATFEDLSLEEESYWYGTQDEDVPMYKFYSGAFSFSNYCMPAYKAWGGFSYANTTGTDFAQLFPDQFHNVVGGGYNSASYAVVFTNGTRCTIETLKSREGSELDYVYVTNTAYAVNNMTHGDSFSGAFAEGDYHKVVFTGDDPEGTPVEFYLADYRNGGSLIVNTWEKVDLKPLGKNVKTIRVTTESSNTGVPAYAALDNLEYANATDGIADAALGDIDGADVKTIRVITASGATALLIENAGRLASEGDLKGLAPGIYIIEHTMADGRKAIIKKAIK
ncbi:MAG: DUF4465 domain-containing protein [Clostridium sp.]|nr:DUF4465 domain-containing protein [Clostridium sp.]